MTDPRDIVVDTGEDEYLDPRLLLWQEDDQDLGNGGEPDPPEPQEAFPIMVPAGINSTPGSLDRVYVRWQFADAQLIEGAYGNINSTRLFNVQLIGAGNGGPYERRYPVDLYVNARVTGGTAVAADYELRGIEGQVATDLITVKIAAGASSGYVIVWAKDAGGAEATETLELTLEGTGDLAVPIDGATPYYVAPDVNQGPDVLTVQIIDSSAPAIPEWRWTVGPTIAYPETVGDVLVEISLDGPSSTDVVIECTTTAGTAVAGTNFTALVAGTASARVTIAAGATTGLLRVRILNDGVLTVGPNLDFDITGAVLSGVCTDPAADTLTVEIVDVPGLSRTIQWAAASLLYTEPESAALEITHPIVCSVNVPFATRTDCVFTVTESNVAAGVGYSLSSGLNVPPLHVRFEPNVSLGAVRFRPLANGIIGDATVTLSLSNVGGSLYALGTNDEVVITIRENTGGVQEPTYLAGPRGVRTGRTIVESTMAVVPPSETLPRYYNTLNNEECQVVGLARLADGKWDAVRVLAMTDDDVAGGGLGGSHTSYPGGSGGPAIEIALGAGSTPAEAGTYPAQDFSGLTFSVIPCNTSSTEFKRTLTDSMASSTTAIRPQWVGPTATTPMFPQEGPDLVRVEYYRVVLREDGDVTDDVTAPAVDTRCMSVEIWLKRSVDSDVVIGEGVLTNSNWDKQQAALDENTRADGPVNLIQCEMQDAPAGWAVTWATANPMETFAAGTAVLVDADGGGAARYFSPCASMPFRFAMYATATSTAAEAQRLLRYRNLATSAGYYGVTRNNIFGVMGDTLIDPLRAGYHARWNATYTHENVGGAYTSRDGWRAMEETGQAFVTQTRVGWNTGTGGYPRLDDRYGWMQSVHPRAADSPSGGGINGQTALIPSCGYWEDAWFALAASVMRQRVAMKDVVSGDEAWQQVLVDEYGHASGYAPVVQAGSTRLGMARLPAFNTRALVLSTYSTGGGSPVTGWPAGGANIQGASTSVFCKAPETRPWNLDEGVQDPDLDIVSHELPAGSQTRPAYQQTDFAHCARYREQIEDGWWGCWSPLAWWQSMHLGAWVTRGMSAHETDPAVQTQPTYGSQAAVPYQTHPGHINAKAAAMSSPLEKGRYFVGNTGITQPWWPIENVRSFGHPATLIAQAYAIGGDRQRAWVKPTNGPNWFEVWADFLTNYTTPTGMFSSGNLAGLNQHDASRWGPPNLPARTGAVPPTVNPSTGAGSATVPPNVRHHGAVVFHQNFISAGAWAVFWRGLKNTSSSSYQLRLLKVLRTGYYIREAARPFTALQNRTIFPAVAITARGEYGQTAAEFPTVPDAGTFMADYWHDFGSGNGHSGEPLASPPIQMAKFGVCVYAWRQARDAGNPEQDWYLTPALAYFYTPDEFNPDWEQVRDIAYANLLGITNANDTGNATTLRANLHGDNTSFMAAFINEMVNRVT